MPDSVEMPAPDAAAKALQSLAAGARSGPFAETLAAALTRLAGTPVAAELLAAVPLENYLRLNLRVVGVEPEKNLLLVRGAVPGAKNSLVFVRRAVKKLA